MFISKREMLIVEVHLRAIIQAAIADDYEYMANIVSLIEDDMNLHRAGKRLLYSIVDYLIRYKDHEA